jgi:hypothetical protein
MKSGIGNIFLSWREGPGHSRIVVGVIKRNETEGVRFSYDKRGVESATKKGFVCYTDFPDLDKVYTENVVDIFGQRLNKSEREDIQNYYDFWEIAPECKNDKYYLLAHTQGILATDNFEFLADYSPVKNLKFISEICSLSILKLPPNTVVEGDTLRWALERNNDYDQFAVQVFKGDTYLGRIKRVHSKVFYKHGGERLKVRVKSVVSNGTLNRVFIKVYNPENGRE